MSRLSDDPALRAVVDQFEGPLLRYAARLTGNAESARDVVQETFLRLCQADAAAENGHLAGWLYTVCRRQALDLVRKGKRMIAASDALAESPADAAEPAAAAEQSESAGNILTLLGTLPARQQEIVRLKFQAGLSYRDIAAAMDLSVTNVGYLLHTAISRLRTALAD